MYIYIYIYREREIANQRPGRLAPLEVCMKRVCAPGGVATAYPWDRTGAARGAMSLT